MKMLPKGFSNVKEALSELKGKALAALVTGGVAMSATPAKADLETALGAVETAATSGISTVSTTQVAIVSAVFGLVLLAVGFRWILSAIKAR